MSDVAALGFAIDSSQAIKASGDLEKLSASAAKVQVAQKQLGTEAQKAAAQFSNSVVPALNNVTGAHDRAYNSLSTRSAFRLMAREASLVGGPLGDVIRTTGTLTVGLQRLPPVVTGGVLAFAAIAAGAYKAVEAFVELEKHQATVAGALGLTKDASGQTVTSLNDLARQLSANGTQSVTDIRAAEMELLKFKTVGAESFGEILRIAKDVAATGFADLKTATIALAKAYKDPTTASEELKAVGLSLSVQQQRLATDLYNSGKAAQSQQVIWKAVSTQAAGADAKAADTLSAAWQRVTTAGQATLEVWGKEIAEALGLKDRLNEIAAAADNLAKPRPGFFQQFAADWAATNAQLEKFLGMLPAATTTGAKGATRMSGADFANQDTGGIDKAEEAWRRYNATIRATQEQLSAAKKRFDEVHVALERELETAGMSVVAQETYNKARDAGVLGDRAAMVALGGLVNARHALNDTREITDQIKQQTAAQQIEAATLGMSAGATAAYRAEQEALARETIKGVTLSDAQIAKIHATAVALGEATQATERLKIAAEIRFDRSTAFLSQEDVAIAQKLKGIYGDDIPKALASSEAAGMRLNNAMKQVNDLGSTFVSGFVTDLSHGVTMIDAMRNATTRLSDSLIKIASDRAVASLLGGLAGGLTLGASGGMAGKGFHSGGVVGSGEHSFTRMVDPMYFANAPRFHSGIGPGELPAILRDNESVLTPAQMRQLAPVGRAGGGDVHVTVNNAPADTKATATTTRDASGNTHVVVQLHRMVDDASAGHIDSGQSAINKSMERRYGLTPRL